jgi:hypothetical protein
MTHLVETLRKQRAWSRETFGPNYSLSSVIDHLKKEVKEIEDDPADLMEYIDAAMLSFEGASRAGYSPEEIADAFVEKLEINIKREWPDWRTAEPDKAITHVKEGKVAP